MPNLRLKQSRFFELMGRNYDFEELDKLGFEFGIEIEEDQEVKDGITTHYLKFDCMNNRPDLLTEATLVRTFKIYLQLIETPTVKLTPSTTRIVVEDSVKQIRPFVAAAILRGVTFDENTFKAFINAQEKLHATFCRGRKYASIGTHDLDSIKGPFKYTTKDPKSFTFVPLNHDK